MIPKISFYDKVANIISKKPISSIVSYADKNPAIFQSSTVFVTSSILRPMAIMGTPAKTEDMKQDRLYSASKSIASGITDLLFSMILFIPTNKIINKYTNNLFKNKESLLYNNQKACNMYKGIINRSLKIATVPIIAYLNFKYIKKIANFITNKDSGK